MDDAVTEKIEDPLVDRPISIQGENDVEGCGRESLLSVETPGRGAELLQNLEDQKEAFVKFVQ